MYAQTNGLISQLTQPDQLALLQKAQTIELKAGDTLSKSHDSDLKIYFPTSGTIALYVRNNSTPYSGLAVGLIGAEGAADLQVALGLSTSNFQLVVQSDGMAYMVNGSVAQKLVKRRKQLLLSFSCYLWSVYQDIARLASRGNTQTIKARLAHWLLLSADRCAPYPLFLTHSEIARMLGVRRVSISIAARELKIKRYISYNRGHIKLLNVDALRVLAEI